MRARRDVRSSHGDGPAHALWRPLIHMPSLVACCVFGLLQTYLSHETNVMVDGR